jgi:hypothetical protein
MNKFLPIHAWRGTRADYTRAEYHVVIPAGHTIEDVTDLHYWHQHALKLNAMDILEVIAADGAFDARLRVLKVGKDGANIGKVWTRVLTLWTNPEIIEAQKAEETGDVPALPDGYSVSKGPGGRHRVKRKTDNTVLKDGLPTLLEAHQWAIEHASAA